MDMPNLPERHQLDFNCGKVKGIAVDTAGQTYHYMQNHPEVAVKFINQWHTQDEVFTTQQLIQKGLTEKTLKFMEIKIPDSVFVLDATFLHYQNGANWNGNSPEYHKNKFKQLKKFINYIIS